MFSRMFGQDPRVSFRTGATGINLLLGPMIPLEDSYWKQYWQLFDNLPDIITLLSSSSLLSANPLNLINLVLSMISHLDHLLNSTISTISNDETSFPSIKTNREALNCIWVLTRVIPFILDGRDDTEISQRGEELFWAREEMTRENLAVDDQFVIEDEEEGSGVAEENVPNLLPPLAQRFLAILVDLLYVPGFTLAPECKSDDSKAIYIIWEQGIASPVAPPPVSLQILSARLEILRLITLLISLPSLTTSPQLLMSARNRWLDVFVEEQEKGEGTLPRKLGLCFLCSLINTAFVGSTSSSLLSPATTPSTSTPAKFDLLNSVSAIKSTFENAIEVANIAQEKLTSFVVGGGLKREGSTKSLLISQSLQLLSILLIDHGGPLSTPATATSPSSTGTALSHNIFAKSFSKLHRPSDLTFLLDGFTTLFASPLNQSFLTDVASLGANLNPTSHESDDSVLLETLILLSRLVEINKKFIPGLVAMGSIGILLGDLIGLVLLWKDDSSRFGLIRVVVFLIQSITADPSFISSEVIEPRYAKNDFVGNLGDYLIVSITRLIFTTQSRFSSLYPSLILSISNIFATLESISIQASQKFIKLFLALSNPAFLIREEANPRLVFWLLESIVHVVENRRNQNSNLIYVLLQNSACFSNLSLFTLARGLTQIKRERRLAKSASATSSLRRISSSRTSGDGGFSSRSLSRTNSEISMTTINNMTSVGIGLSEKARGKLRDENDEENRVEEAIEEEEEEVEEGDEEAELVGKNGFVPSEQWIASWRDRLPLDSLQIILSELKSYLSSNSTLPIALSSPLPSPAIILQLQSPSTQVHLQPFVPTSNVQLTKRRFNWNDQSNTWVASLIFGRVYLVQLEVVRGVKVRLFGVVEQRRELGVGGLATEAAKMVLGKVKPF